MKITIVYDNCLAREGLRTGWGFSAFIQAEQASPLLFDTGADGPTLLHNMKELSIDPGVVGIVVISHAHGDHTGGLSDILAMNNHATVYLPASARANIPGREVVSVSQSIQVSGGVFSTGELAGIEQSLAIRTARGLVVVTGCSHPGVGAILDAAASLGSIYGIIGGFHGFHDLKRLEGLSMICPCHCTQYKEELANQYPEEYIECGAGRSLEVP